MVTSVAQISVTCNARNIELYNKGEYMGLTRGSLESDVLFVHNMDDYTSVNGIVTNEISFKFLSLKPVKYGPVLVDTFSIVVGPSQSAPSPPEPMPGSNSMAMLMMMMSAAKNGQSQTPAPFALSDEVHPPPAKKNESMRVLESKEEKDKVNISPTHLPDFAETIMSQVSALLDRKLMPIVDKLDKVEETLARLERQLAPDHKNDNTVDNELVVMSAKDDLDTGLKSDILALKRAVRSST